MTASVVNVASSSKLCMFNNETAHTHTFSPIVLVVFSADWEWRRSFSWEGRHPVHQQTCLRQPSQRYGPESNVCCKTSKTIQSKRGVNILMHKASWKRWPLGQLGFFPKNKDLARFPYILLYHSSFLLRFYFFFFLFLLKVFAKLRPKAWSCSSWRGLKRFGFRDCFSGEGKSYEEQLKQMLRDLGKEKDKGLEKPLPHMKQVRSDPVFSPVQVSQRV